ncbi:MULTISPECIES: hypothetical protein [unclassified Fusibacter]|uniref:hypothetical protein n=1 Tax=unclassified Fusibacter TaxID=2624464 RepID=UPI0010107B46|nr:MULTISPECIES: hypothetical protein [unclassified Fusibacter]MCK8059173.1 hypothetical protein [Fusibacter sp. A2]NPE22582.1 hypothetical protein [Fusibacter sp. A1]RXV60683.1 hypothetical protein DWB64_12095 [Fusibacter sp. A1]
MKLLKELQKERVMDDAKELWMDYRKELTEFIVNNTDRDTTIAIFGAGYCNDIDLTIFSSHFSGIELVDFDYHAMQEAMKSYELDGRNKVKTKKVDFLGIDVDEYDELAKFMIKQVVLPQNPNMTSVVHRLEKYVDKIRKHRMSFSKNTTYDYVMVVGVHSHLISFIEQIIEQACIQKGIPVDGTVRQKITELNNVMAVKLNEKAFDLADKGIFVGVETAVNQSDSLVQGAYQAHNHIVKAINDGRFANFGHVDLTFTYSAELVYKMSIIKIVEAIG